MAHSGEYVGDFGYLREYGTDIDISNAMRHMTHYRETVTKPEVNNVVYCFQRRIVKFRHAVF